MVSVYICVTATGNGFIPAWSQEDLDKALLMVKEGKMPFRGAVQVCIRNSKEHDT